MQTATILCDAQHNTLKLVHIAPFVKSQAGGVAECPASGLSSGSHQASLVSSV